MKVLVANLGSTSFKYRLFDMTNEQQLARGGVERIGAPSSRAFVQIGDYKGELELSVPHHGVAVKACVDQLTDPKHGCLKSASEISAIGFRPSWRSIARRLPNRRFGAQCDGRSQYSSSSS